MRKRITALICIFLVAVFTFGFSACSGGEGEKTGIPVIYELEGGTFKNSEGPIEVRYNFPENAQKTIKPLQFEKFGEVIKAGYYIEGWYKKKETVNDETVYSDKWNFEQDTVTESGVTLYARWLVNVSYIYHIGYYNADEFVTVGIYRTSFGISFGARRQNILDIADRYEGHTATGKFFSDKEMTKPFDEKFAFEESDTDQIVQVVAEYIEGDYKIINSAKDLESNTGEYAGKTLYVMNDIDFEDSSVDFNSLFAVNREGKRKYEGMTGANGTTKSLKNVTVKADYLNAYHETTLDGAGTGNIRVSLFGEIDGVTVKNIAFEDVKFEVEADHEDAKLIYIAPLAIKATNCTFESVSIKVSTYSVMIGSKDEHEVSFKESKSGDEWLACFEPESITGVTIIVANREVKGY